jgi:hypothetical protein
MRCHTTVQQSNTLSHPGRVRRMRTPVVFFLSFTPVRLTHATKMIMI